MIKIIKDGQTDFIAKCSTCGCEFSYQLVDIGLNSVVCPCCGGYVAHKEFKELLPTTIERLKREKRKQKWRKRDDLAKRNILRWIRRKGIRMV